ncbi:MAG: adenine phosphoribosyltransferase [Pseudomonadota bacterium]
MTEPLDLKAHIRTIPDFPKPGILFRDVTTLFQHGGAFAAAVDRMAAFAKAQGAEVIAGFDARGFILGGAVARSLQVGFVPLRKKGKLPHAVIGEAYTLEYGEETLEAHADSFSAGQRVLLVDDLIATGGTALAGISLARRLEAEVVGFAAVIDLPDLGGADRIRAAGVTVAALIAFEGH